MQSHSSPEIFQKACFAELLQIAVWKYLLHAEQPKWNDWNYIVVVKTHFMPQKMHLILMRRARKVALQLLHLFWVPFLRIVRYVCKKEKGFCWEQIPTPLLLTTTTPRMLPPTHSPSISLVEALDILQFSHQAWAISLGAVHISIYLTYSVQYYLYLIHLPTTQLSLCSKKASKD